MKKILFILCVSVLLLSACAAKKKTDQEISKELVDILLKSKQKMIAPELTTVKAGQQAIIPVALWDQYAFPLTFRIKVFEGVDELSPSNDLGKGYALVWENNTRVLDSNGVNVRPIVVISSPSMTGERLFNVVIEETNQDGIAVYSQQAVRVRWK